MPPPPPPTRQFSGRHLTLLALAGAVLVSAAIFFLRGSAMTAAPTYSTRHVASPPPPPASPEFYTQEIEPIFQGECFRCHAGMNHRGKLQLDTRAGLLRGGHDGAVVVPGHPEQSILVALIRHQGPADDPMPMPPKRKLSDPDIAAITAWIQAGAVMPADQQR